MEQSVETLRSKLQQQYDEVLHEMKRVCERSMQREEELQQQIRFGHQREAELLDAARQAKEDRKTICELKRSFKMILRELQLREDIQVGQEEPGEEEPEEEEPEGEVVGVAEAPKLPAEPFPESPFAENRRRLNEAILAMAVGRKKVTGKRLREDNTIACSSVRWSKVESVYKRRMTLDNDAFPVEDISAAKLSSIMEELRRHQQWCGICLGIESEARRTCSINTIMCGVAAILDDKAVRINHQVTLRNEALLSTGKADMVATRNEQRKIIVVEAKKEDFEQGQAQDLLMMDIAIADNEKEGVKVTPVFGIVSNFLQWNFYRYDDNGIKYTVDQINEMHSLEIDVRRIIGRVYNMLHDD